MGIACVTNKRLIMGSPLKRKKGERERERKNLLKIRYASQTDLHEFYLK